MDVKLGHSVAGHGAGVLNINHNLGAVAGFDTRL